MTTTTLLTPTSIRNAVACGIGFLILGKVLATQPAKTFLFTLACLSAGQAIMMASSGKKEEEDDDDNKTEEEVDLGPVPDEMATKEENDEQTKEDTEKEEDSTDLESYEMVNHDPAAAVEEEKDAAEKNATGKILLKEPTIEGKTMQSDTVGGVSIATDGNIAVAGTTAITKDSDNDNNNSPKIIAADESSKIIEFVEEYCEDLIDTAVAEVLNEVVSQVVHSGADQEQREE